MSGELCDEIARRVRRGEQPDSIEAELLSSRLGLGDDERAAGWLYAWLAQQTPARRFERAARLEHVHD
jgi:hypothetical protein